MKTQPPAPIRTVYYTDERNDEFSSAEIETRRIDESYRYIDPRPGWKAARFIAYRLFAIPRHSCTASWRSMPALKTGRC